MVTLDEWRQVQERCFGGETSRRRKGVHDFPYTGLIKCGTCGKWVTAERQRGRLGRGNWVYYHCNNKSGVCGKKSVREDVLESRIDACLGQITITPELRRSCATPWKSGSCASSPAWRRCTRSNAGGRGQRAHAF
jgi:hypothetical protein